MECQRSDSIGRRSAILKKPPALDIVDNKPSTIMFGIGQKLPAASKCKDAASSHLAEGHHSGGQSRPHHSYGATDTFSQPDGQPDMLSCGPNDHHHKHIHRVFQVNRVVKYTSTCSVCHIIVKERKRKFLQKYRKLQICLT